LIARREEGKGSYSRQTPGNVRIGAKVEYARARVKPM
jgi:hypothetical protein